MSDHAVKFNAVNGLSTAVNFAVSSTSLPKAISGTVLVIAVGAQRVAYRFGGELDTVTGGATGNGFRLPANSLVRVSVPANATHIHFIRADASDSDISLQGADGGI